MHILVTQRSRLNEDFYASIWERIRGCFFLTSSKGMLIPWVHETHTSNKTLNHKGKFMTTLNITVYVMDQWIFSKVGLDIYTVIGNSVCSCQTN